MTLGGIAACIGVVIDDAIVMVENISVHQSLGQTPAEAARSAIQELTPALIGSTLTPIMVFVPLVFLGGLTAVFFRALAMTLVTALLASLFLAIFFTPVLARLVFRARPAAATDLAAAEQAGEGRLMRWLTERYEAALAWALAHSRTVLAGALAVLAATVGLYFRIGSDFLPPMDEGAFVLDYIMPPGTSLEETDRVLRHIQRILEATPEVESDSRRTGARLALAIAEPNTGDFLVKLKRDRRRSVDEVHENEAAFYKVAEEVEQWLPKVRGVVDVVNQSVVIGPQVNFRVDPEKAHRAGFSVSDVADLEAGILDGRLASTMIQGQRLVGVRVRYPKQYRDSVDKLRSLLVTSPAGVTVPLASIAHVEIKQGVREIRRENLRNNATVTARLSAARLSGRDLGSAINEIQRRLPQEINIPPGTDVEFGGLYKIQRESFHALTMVAVMSVILIFVILVFEFRSFSHPVAILAATVLCTFGALLALLLTGATLNISSFMGAIMVVGIVHKNGILMLDSEKHFSGLGLPLRDAVFQAGRRRLRPILMTALSTIFGMAPLAFGVGHGADILQPLAIAVIGGVSVSMILSLVVTPVLFYRLHSLGR